MYVRSANSDARRQRTAGGTAHTCAPRESKRASLRLECTQTLRDSARRPADALRVAGTRSSQSPPAGSQRGKDLCAHTTNPAVRCSETGTADTQGRRGSGALLPELAAHRVCTPLSTARNPAMGWDAALLHAHGVRAHAHFCTQRTLRVASMQRDPGKRGGREKKYDRKTEVRTSARADCPLLFTSQVDLRACLGTVCAALKLQGEGMNRR
jgi:hypothetical protein